MITRRKFLVGLVKAAGVVAAIGIPVISPVAKRLKTIIPGNYEYREYDRALSDKEISELADPTTRWDLYRPL